MTKKIDSSAALPENPWFRTTGDANDFWLVQRMQHVEPREDRDGVDRIFSFGYMGAAEFEGNMAFVSLQSMRDQGQFQLVTRTVERLGVTRDVHFVGPAKSLEQSITSFTEWMSGERLLSKRGSRFDSAFQDGVGDGVDSWWAHRAGLVFTLDLAVAEAALAVFAPEKVTVNLKQRWFGRG
jgi:hypothetical protein